MKQKKRVTETKKQVGENTKRSLYVRPVVGCVVLLLSLVIAFPEIGQFAVNSLKEVAGESHQDSIQSDTPEEVESPETSQPLPMQSSQEHPLPPEIANFKPTFQKSLATKKIFFQGRRIAPIQLFPSRNRTAEDVKVYLFEDFLSPEECDGLRAVHDSHIQMANEVPPLLCFESLDTLRKHLSYAKKSDIKVTRDVFTKGTYCLNSTFSTRVADFLHYNWSYSTAFYPNESVFSNMVAALIQETTGLRKENGGKFQITSYPLHIGYKKHTDCTEGTGELRDRMATILVYLDDVEVGGETEFTELGIKVRPKKGQALVWNNMNPKGECIPASVHEASKVTKGKKYILQRWYYHKSFWSLGRRPEPPSLPERTAEQALVLCDEYKHGSCRWYDEWLPDVMEDYRRRSATLI